MKTKDRILATALELFNIHGTAAVSTNHIAEAMGISPGNLYYHFPNKTAIISALFEQQFDHADRIFDLPTDRPPTLADVMALVRANFAMLYDYRFIYREMLALLRQDPDLHRRYLAVRARGYDGFNTLIDAFSAANILYMPTAATLGHLTELCWLISEFWLASLEMQAIPINDQHLQRGVDLMMAVLQPYLTP